MLQQVLVLATYTRLQFCPSLFLSRNASRKWRETRVCVCRRCVTDRVVDQRWNILHPVKRKQSDAQNWIKMSCNAT